MKQTDEPSAGTYFLTADCGGTKSAFLLTDETGHMAASYQKEDANYMVTGIPHLTAVLNAGLEECCRQAQITPDRIRMFHVSAAGYGDIPENEEQDTRKVQSAVKAVPITLGSDTDNAIAGSLLGSSGIHVIAGTGSIGIGIDRNGNRIRCGGWHHFFGGDEGSAYWIACRLLQVFTKQADGRLKETSVVPYLMKKYGLREPEEILDLTLEKWGGRRENIAKLAIDAADLAAQNDPAAQNIFADAGVELAGIVMAIWRRGSFEAPVPVSWSGGVFGSLEYFRDSLEKHLASIPHSLQAPALPPLEGGILLAMQESGTAVPPEVIACLQEEVQKKEKSS